LHMLTKILQLLIASVDLSGTVGRCYCEVGPVSNEQVGFTAEFSVKSRCCRQQWWEHATAVTPRSIVPGCMVFPDPSFNFWGPWTKPTLCRPPHVSFSLSIIPFPEACRKRRTEVSRLYTARQLFVTLSS
jgi:hypothetical protein